MHPLHCRFLFSRQVRPGLRRALAFRPWRRSAGGFIVMKKIRAIALTTEVRPVPELVRELAIKSQNFVELALILAEKDSELVHFVWHHGDGGEASKIDRLVKQGWVPIGFMGISEGGRLLARPLEEHADGNGISRYLKTIMDRAARLYEEEPEPISRAVH